MADTSAPGQPDPPVPAEPASSGGLAGRLAALDSGRMLRWVFKATLAGAIALVAVDAWTLATTGPDWRTPDPRGPGPGRDIETARPEPGDQVRPYAPGVRPVAPDGGVPVAPGGLPLPAVGGAMSFTFLEPTDARPAAIVARGTLEMGSAARLAAFDEETGQRAEALMLDSPGGLVHEGLDAGRWVRERRLDTMVVENARCASSCPLVLAGGVDRRVHPDAWVGVHQMFRDDRTVAPIDDTMRTTQTMTADVLRHFVEMGVSAEIMEPAMRTPPVAIYLFTPDELISLALATELLSP